MDLRGITLDEPEFSPPPPDVINRHKKQWEQGVSFEEIEKYYGSMTAFIAYMDGRL